MIKLTKEQYLAAGKNIMNDSRCSVSVKAAVRQGTSGIQDENGNFVYTTNADAGQQNEWYDLIIISCGQN